MKYLSNAKFYSLDGIFTSLISFLEITEVIKAMRKDKKKLNMILNNIEQNYILFIEILNKNGIKYFSYADPSAMIEILGRYHEEWIVERFIKVLEKLSKLNIVIHICPVLFDSLKGKLNFEEKKVENYQDEILGEKGFRIIGGSCIKNKGRSIYYYSK